MLSHKCWNQFSSFAQSCPTLCDSMDCKTPGLPVYHQLPEFTQTPIYWVGDAIQPSHPLIPFSSCPQSFPASGSFPMSQLFTSGSPYVIHYNKIHCYHCCSIPKLCPTLCDRMDCSRPGFLVLHHLLEFAQTHVHWINDAIQPSHPLILFPSCSQSFPATESFPVS